MSARKASTSEGVGGRPVRSSVTRRMSVVGSASGEGARPSRSRRSRTKLSIGFRAQVVFRVFGNAGRAGGTKAQCFCHFAPCSIHRRISSICRSVSLRPVRTGGMRSLSSAAVTRTTNTPSPVSNRKLVTRFDLSGPWQLKQLSDRIGRMSRLNSMVSGRASPASMFVIDPK